MKPTTVLLLLLAFNFLQVFAQQSDSFLSPLHDSLLAEGEGVAIKTPEVVHTPETSETPQEPEAPELTPEQEAYVHSFKEVPNAPPDFKRMPLGHIRTDPTIMRSYAQAVPVFLLRAIASHEKYKKSTDETERETLLDRGFFPPGPYLLDLIYIFKKKVTGGMVFVFGVTTHQCAEKTCKGKNYKCSYPSFFSAFEPNEGKQRAFLDFEVKMAPEGFQQCPNYKLKSKSA